MHAHRDRSRAPSWPVGAARVKTGSPAHESTAVTGPTTGDRFGAPAILAIQRTLGNRATQRSLRREPNDLAVGDAIPDEATPDVGNPLFGLENRDGITFGTEDRRDRVKLLQEKLNAHIGAGLVPDGKFGPLTLTALQTFQTSRAFPPTTAVDLVTADALMDKPPTTPIGPGGTTTAENTAISAELIQAGEQLKIAGIQVGEAGRLLSLSGTFVAASNRLTAVLISSGLFQAGSQFSAAGKLLEQAGQEMVTTATTPTPVTPSDNTLVGLQRGDGLTLGTEDRRERVTLLQQKLNERMIANLKLDGKFGPRTGRALREFQSTIGMPQNEVVDQITGDALLFGVLPGVQRVGGGPTLTLAGAIQQQASAQLSIAGSGFLSDGNPLDSLAGGSLITASSAVTSASSLLQTAGTQIGAAASGPDTVGAGLTLATVGTPQREAGANILNAGANVSGAGNPTDFLTGGQIVSAGNALSTSGDTIEQAGQHLEAAGTLMEPSAPNNG